MRCPECGQGTISLCRWKQKNGVWRDIYQCTEDFSAWADEFCRECAVGSHDFIEHEEIVEYAYVCEADLDVSREDYYGWNKEETSDILCPYCRTRRLTHGITAQTKREIYECPRCQTVWIGSVLPENVSNYRKYVKDGLRIPDETEYDCGGLKWIKPVNKKPTDLCCPNCLRHSMNPVDTGTVAQFGKKIFICEGCFSVWEKEVRRGGAKWYGEFLRIEQLYADAAALKEKLGAAPEQVTIPERLELARLYAYLANGTNGAEAEKWLRAAVPVLESAEFALKTGTPSYGHQQELWDMLRQRYHDLAGRCTELKLYGEEDLLHRKVLSCFGTASQKMLDYAFFTYRRSAGHNQPEALRCIKTLMTAWERMLEAAAHEYAENPQKLRETYLEFSGYYRAAGDFLAEQQCTEPAAKCQARSAELLTKAHI